MGRQAGNKKQPQSKQINSSARARTDMAPRPRKPTSVKHTTQPQPIYLTRTMRRRRMRKSALATHWSRLGRSLARGALRCWGGGTEARCDVGAEARCGGVARPTGIVSRPNNTGISAKSNPRENGSQISTGTSKRPRSRSERARPVGQRTGKRQETWWELRLPNEPLGRKFGGYHLLHHNSREHSWILRFFKTNKYHSQGTEAHNNISNKD
jgi:hypothetical protein